MLTMQRILARELPTALEISPEEIGAEGSPFSREVCMDRLESANKDLAHDAALRESRYLQAEFEFEGPGPTGTQYEYPVEYPANVDTWIKLSAITDQGREISTVWNQDRRNVWNYYGGAAGTFSSFGYRIQGNQIIMLQPRYSLYRLFYQRSPGSLCYGTVQSASGVEVTLSVPTAGRLSNQLNDYVGDTIVFTKDGETDVIAVVTGFSPAGRVITLREEVSVDDTWEYSFVSWLPRSWQMTHVFLAATRFAAVRQSAAAVCAANYGTMIETLRHQCRPGDAVTATRVAQSDPGMTFGQSWTNTGGARNWNI